MLLCLAYRKRQIFGDLVQKYVLCVCCQTSIPTKLIKEVISAALL